MSNPDNPVHTLVPDLASNKGQDHPAVSGDLVVWLKNTSPKEIHYTFLGGGCPSSCTDNVIALSGFSPEDIAVRGHKIVFQNNAYGSNPDIYLYDLDNPSAGAQPVAAAPGNQYKPQISDTWLSWADNSTGTARIHAVPIGGGSERVVDGNANHSLSGDRLVFTREYMGQPDVGIYRLDLADPQSQPARFTAMEAWRPSLDRDNSDLVVWESSSRDIGDNEIYLHNFATGITQQVSSSPDTVLNPVISDSHIVWSDDRGAKRNLYHNRLGETVQQIAEQYKPELFFSHDINNASRNDFEPRTVNLMVDGAEKLVTTGGEIYNPSIQGLTSNPGQDNYLDLPGSPANPFHDYDDDYLAQLGQGDYPVTAYSRVVQRAEGTDKTVIQYWLNYYYNNWYNNHEGDWEMVQVILNENLEPEAAAYSQHGHAFKKNWNEFGFSKTGTHPQVFVAEGSHANYFFEASALHFLDAATPNAFNDRTGSASSAMPAIDMDGLAGNWANFAGMWGEEEKWWWPPYITNSGPRGPAFQGDSWSQPLTWSDSNPMKGYLNDWVIAAHSPVEIHLYDPQGNHVGKNATGGIDMQIPGSEYFERDEDHSKNIVVRNADVLAGYTLKIEGTGTGTMDLELQVPDFGGNVVDKPQYLAVEVNPSMKAELGVTPAKDFDLRLDSDGDGSFEEQRPPDVMESLGADFTPPTAITNLSVTDVTSGSATLNWSAPGDDGAQGTAFRYDLRYLTEPITEDNWQYAETADSLPDPQPAGSPETATITGLEAGTTYYFSIRARDDSWQESWFSNAAQTTTTIPNLTWAIQRVYWASWEDYQNRHLSIDYRMGNSGTGTALQSTVQASLCTPDTVYAVTALPLLVGDINLGTNRVVTLKYYAPSNVGSFTTTSYATCNDDASREYWFPGPMP